MQGKGYIKFFLLLFVLVALWQYFLNIPIANIESQADKYALEQSSHETDEQLAYQLAHEARVQYLDSVSGEKVLSIPFVTDYTYTDLKKRQLALGLDLKGGMSAVLQVDLKEFVKTLSNNRKDPIFLGALDSASVRLKSEQTDFITLFGREYNALSDGKPLASIFATSPITRDKVNNQTSNADVLQTIRGMANETVQLTFERLKERIDGLGVAQPNITLDKGRDLILVELPGVANPERVRDYLQASAKLEFWEIYRVTDNQSSIINAFLEADRKLKLITGDTTDISVQDSSYVVTDTIYDNLGNFLRDTTYTTSRPGGLDGGNFGPLLSKFQVNGVGGQLSFSQAVMGVAPKNQIKSIDQMLQLPEISRLFPRDLGFRWARNAYVDYQTKEQTDLYQLYAVKKRRGSEKAPLEGDAVISADKTPDPQTNQTVVSISMNQKGAKTWGQMTTRAAQDNNREVAIALDNKIVSAPSVRQPILGGRTQIEGNFSLQEAEDLAKFLRVGKLPANTSIIQESLVGPFLGQENIDRSLKSLFIGFGLVLLFMLLYYGSSGIISIIALFANLFFIFAALGSFGTVLTLPGIAGIILTIGMAVDANVIIYERIREELREGKALANAVSDGFKHSYSAIIDANVTTILTAMVLAYFGLGPIKGFAVILIIGVFSSLFTAVLLGRLMIEWWIGRGNNLNFWTGFSKNLFTNLKIDWLGKRKITYVLSLVLITAGVVSMLTRGFDLGVDFKGGYSYTIDMDGSEISSNDLRSTLTDVFGGAPIVKSVDNGKFNITTSYLINESGDEAQEQVLNTLFTGVNSLVGNTLEYDKFKSINTLSGQGPHITTSAKVGPTIADDIKTSSLYATVFALLLIFLYILIRFSKWQYSMGAVAALFHDTLIVLGLFSLLKGVLPFSLEIDQAFIAALLTVIGYSINDTVVVFDRVREFFGIHRQKPRKDVINMAINSTISRTMITSLTTLFVVLVLLLFGGTSIKGFAFALMVGIVVGTYSSVFIATPIMYDLSKDEVKKTSRTGSYKKTPKATSV